jgi:peptide/nickel transport system permease protein
MNQMDINIALTDSDTILVDGSLISDSSETEPRRRSPIVQFFLRLFREKRMGVIGAALVLLLLFVGIFADTIAPYSYSKIHMRNRLDPPSEKFLLGNDQMGRDLLSRVIHGARISMYVGLGASTLNIIVALAVGLLSGYIGGRFDLFVQRIVDALLVFPGLIVLITVMSLVGTGMVQVILVLGVWGGIGGIRVVRSAVFTVRFNPYIVAAKTIGCSEKRIIWKHILPNIVPVVIIMFSLSMGGNILAEAGLSFLGLGIPAPIPSWGLMLSGSGRLYMLEAPWLTVWPGLALAIAVFGINMFGDAIRDLIDPRLRGGGGSFSIARFKREFAETEKLEKPSKRDL